MVKITAYADTDPGKSHEVNEDSVLAYVRPIDKGKALGLLIVADGIGGHKAGEIASQIVIDTMYKSLKPFLERDSSVSTMIITDNTDSPNTPATNPYLESKLKLAIQAANADVYNYSKQNPEDAGNLGSTVTCALVESNQAIIANVGDSRTYLLSQGELTQITKDHSYVATLVEKGMADEDAFYNHPHRSVITRALGNEENLEVDITFLSLKKGDRLLLCSDGCWEYIANHKLLQEILSTTPNIKDAVNKLIEAANKAGGGDNIGVAVAEIS